MAIFFCVGFPDLDRAWNFHGHVANHEIYLTRDEAEKANAGKITMVHEFYVRDALYEATIKRLQADNRRLLDSFTK